MKQLPNMLTSARVVLIPIFVAVYYLPWAYAHFVAAMIFIVASITDWFDGYLARRLNVASKMGAFLDPVADKLLVATALVLVATDSCSAALAIPAAVIIGREIVISALREWMATIGQRTSVAVGQIGKWKTAAQMFAIMFLVANRPGYHSLFGIFGYILIYIAVVLTIWSMVMYLVAAWRVMQD
tara:strand:+ start:17726 stop:18277 length:552 start_codon:yes stop_codon:yes gene_type:complete